MKFGYWDNLKKGLMAGETLHHDLKRLEVSYLERSVPGLEIAKNISLVSLAPGKLLELKMNGSCEFELPEWLFDLDTPGHYRRRMKMLGVTIPCVTGPYTSVPCTVQLLSNRWRQVDTVNASIPYPFNPASDDRFIVDWAVRNVMVTSTGQNDSGLFEPSLRDERYLPFEGAGVISRWKLELPMDFKPFDYSTISDVILHVRYTAEHRDHLREPAVEYTKTLLGAVDGAPLFRLVSLRHEFPSEWHRFVTGSTTPVAGMTVELGMSRFPYFVQGRAIRITKATVVPLPDSPDDVVGIAPGRQASDPLVNPWSPGSNDNPGQPGPWTIATSENPRSFEDLFVIVEYGSS